MTTPVWKLCLPAFTLLMGLGYLLNPRWMMTLGGDRKPTRLSLAIVRGMSIVMITGSGLYLFDHLNS